MSRKKQFVAITILVTLYTTTTPKTSPEYISFLSQFFQPGDTVYDIGACVGQKVDQYLDAGAGHVFAVEPQPYCLERLCDRYRDNRNVDIIPFAIADHEGVMNLAICSDALALTTLSTKWKTHSRYSMRHGNIWDKIVPVKLITLEHMIRECGTPTFCKIDVENFEYEVLATLHNVPANKRPRTISFEFHEETGDKTFNCLKLLTECGYRKFNMVIIDAPHLTLHEWVSAAELLKEIETMSQENLFGDLLCGDIYAQKDDIAPTQEEYEKLMVIAQTYLTPPTTIFTESHASLSLIQPGDIVIDAGAYVGTRTDQYLKKNPLRVIAIEPQPICARVIYNRFQNNPRVVLIPIGIADRQGSLPFYQSLTFLPFGSFSKDGISRSRYKTLTHTQWTNIGTTPVVTLDQVIEQYGIPRLCKLTVEHFEFEALCGLTQYTPEYLSFAFYDETEDKTELCLDRLDELGYPTYNLTIGRHPYFYLNEWVSLSRIKQIISELSQDQRKYPLCGEIYAHHS